MKKQLVRAKNFVKQNKIPLLSALIAVAVVAVPTYAHQARQADIRRQEAALEQLAQVNEDGKLEVEEVAQVSEEPKEEPAAAPTQKPAPQQDYYKPEAKPHPPKEYNKQKPTIEYVAVSLSSNGSTVVASIGSGKAGTCNFTFKGSEGHTSLEVPANGGACSTSIPAPGGFTKVHVTYMAHDKSAKGNSSLAL
mgnify:CR=1 FL=1